MTDQDAIYGKAVGDKNRKRILEYFGAHPFNSRRDCARALGLSEIAVGRHVRAIKEEIKAGGNVGLGRVD